MLKKKETPEYITNEIEISSGEENSNEENSDKENFDEENYGEEILMKKIKSRTWALQKKRIAEYKKLCNDNFKQ